MPEIPYTELPNWLLVATAIASMALLIKGADLTVDGAAGLAYRFGISEVIVGATIVSLGTTTPEATDISEIFLKFKIDRIIMLNLISPLNFIYPKLPV